MPTGTGAIREIVYLPLDAVLASEHPSSRHRRLLAGSVGILALVLVIAALLPGASASASTSTAPPGTTVTVAVVGRTTILGPKATKRIISALATGGTGLAVIACGAVVPADLKQYCGLIVAVLAGAGGVGDVGDRCLSITVGFGIPPIQVSLVPCPAADPVHVPGRPEIFDDVPGDPAVPVPAPLPVPVPLGLSILTL